MSKGGISSGSRPGQGSLAPGQADSIISTPEDDDNSSRKLLPRAVQIGDRLQLQRHLVEDKHTNASGWMERKAILRAVKGDVSFIFEHQGSRCLYVKHHASWFFSLSRSTSSNFPACLDFSATDACDSKTNWRNSSPDDSFRLMIGKAGCTPTRPLLPAGCG